jgi:hypothetical protein
MSPASEYLIAPGLVLAIGTWAALILCVVAKWPLLGTFMLSRIPPPLPDDVAPMSEVAPGPSTTTQDLIAQAGIDAAAAKAAQARATASLQAAVDSMAADFGVSPTVPTNELANQLTNLQAAANGHGSTLDKILVRLANLETQGAKMATAIDDLTQAVHDNTSQVGSILTALDGYVAEVAALAAANGTPAQFAALATELKANNAKMAAAAVANVPAIPGTPATPGTPPVPTAAKK